MKNIKQIMISTIKRISSTTTTQRYFVSSVVFLFGVGFLILAQIRWGENTKKFQSPSDEKTGLKWSQLTKKQVVETESQKTIETGETLNSKPRELLNQSLPPPLLTKIQLLKMLSPQVHRL